jgi:molybdenum cofactor cytidylyltransferase
MPTVIPGVILAAGLSTRMGRPKALLRVGPDGPTFVHHIATALLEGGVADALVVGRDDDDALRAEVEALGPPVRFVVNAHADEGQLSSVIAGLNAADHPGIIALLVTPVDLPLVVPATVRALLDAFSSTRAAVVRATHKGQHGHPVIFARAVFDELRRADRALGAKSVVQAHARELVDVDVDDPGVLHDLDEPDDYERLFNRPV